MANSRRPLRYPVCRRQFAGDFDQNAVELLFGDPEAVLAGEIPKIRQYVEHPSMCHECVFPIG